MSINLDKYNINENNDNIEEKTLSFVNIKNNKLPIKNSKPINIKNQNKYDNNLINPPPNDDHLNNKDFNLLLSKYSISPNTYHNFDFMKYNNNK